MLYFEVTEHELQDARVGLELTERLLHLNDFEPYVYVLTSKQDVLLSAQEVLDDDLSSFDEDDADRPEQITVAEVAVAIPFNSKMLPSFIGSGVVLKDEDFSYGGGGGEDARTANFRYANRHSRPSLRTTDCSVIALSDSDMYLDEFMKQYGSRAKALAKRPKTVERSFEPAVKASSKRGSVQVRNAIDNFLSE